MSRGSAAMAMLWPSEAQQKGQRVWLGCLVLAYLLPMHLHPYRTFFHDALCVFGVWIALAFVALEARPAWSWPGIVYLPLGLIGVIFVQWGVGGVASPADLLLPLGVLVVWAVSMGLGAHWSVPTGGARALCALLADAHLLAGSVSVALQCVQLSGVNLMPWIMYLSPQSQPFVRPFANVAQPNMLALLLCLALAGVWWNWQDGRVRGRLALAYAGWLLFGLTLTQSRIGWVIVPAYALLLACARGARRPPLAWLAAGVLGYVALVLCWPVLAQWAGWNAGGLAEHVGGRSERLSLWTQAWIIARQHPWLGVGWMGFSAAQVGVAPLCPTGIYAEHAHNVFLNLAAEIGWPLTLLFSAGALLWGRRVLAVWRDAPTHLFAALCLLAVGVHSQVEFPLWYSFVLLPVGMLLGMLHQTCFARPERPVRPAAPLLALVLAASMLVLVMQDYLRVVSGFRALSWAQAGYEVEAHYLQQPKWTMFPQFFTYFHLMQLRPRKGMPEEELRLFEEAGARFGFVHILNRRAEAFALNGRPDAALASLQAMARLHPLAYPEYYRYWQARGRNEPLFEALAARMPEPEAAPAEVRR